MDHHADHRKDQRQLVGNELSGGAKRTHQRVLVRTRPPSHQDSYDADRANGKCVKDPDLEVADNEIRTSRNDQIEEERRHHNDVRSEREHPLVGVARNEVFFLNELDRVADVLEPTVVTTRVHWTKTALHVGHHLQEEEVAE